MIQVFALCGGYLELARESMIRDAPAEAAPEVQAPVASEPTAPAGKHSAIAPAAGPAKAVGKE